MPVHTINGQPVATIQGHIRRASHVKPESNHEPVLPVAVVQTFGRYQSDKIDVISPHLEDRSNRPNTSIRQMLL